MIKEKLTKCIKKCIIKQKRKFKDYKNCQKANRLENEKEYFQKNLMLISLKEIV